MGVTHANDDTLMATIRARALLVIEDDAPIRRALQNALSDVADRLLEAATGKEGIDLAATERPELIILDLGLPDALGVDVCREIRSWSRVPIVVLSARYSPRAVDHRHRPDLLRSGPPFPGALAHHRHAAVRSCLSGPSLLEAGLA